MRAARLTEQPAYPLDLHQKGNPVDDQTVPDHWSTDSWAETMRDHLAKGGDLYPFTVGVIESMVAVSRTSDAETVARIRAVLAARVQVEAER